MKRKWKKLLLAVVIIVILGSGGVTTYKVFTHVEQKVFETVVELGSRAKFSAEDYLSGNSYMLKECNVDDSEVDTKTLGNYNLKITCGKEEYIVEVEVVDTTPPEIDLFDLCVPVIIGEELEIDMFMQSYCEVDDLSVPIEVTFSNGSNSIEVTEDMVNAEGNVEVLLIATDARGNSSQREMEFTGIVLREGDIPAWYNRLSEELQDACLIDINEMVMHGEKLTVDEAIAELAKMFDCEKSEKGEELASIISIDIIGDTCVDYETSLYNGIGYVPENVLRKFSAEGWKFYVTDEDLEEKYGMRSPIEGDTVIGITVYDKKRIEVNMEEQTFFADTNKYNITHEFGHFVDYVCGWSSGKKEMLDLYEEVSNQTGKTGVLKTDQNERRQIYREYSFTSEKEFFADSFEYCMLEPEIMQTEFPEVYEYIMKCIESI